MPAIPFNLVGLTQVGPPSALDISRIELATAAAVIGSPAAFSSIPGRRPLLELLWRIGMALSNLSEGSSSWGRSPSYDRLDPTEKTSVSYFLGMVQAQLTCTRVLGYTHLSHLDALLLQAGRSLTGTRPDFLAVNAMGNAYVATVEAKGRTGGFAQPVIVRAKKQARAIPGLPGFAPQATIASLAYFDKNGAWSAHLEDPPSAGAQLRLSPEDVLLVHYRAVIAAGRETRTWDVAATRASFSLPEMPLRLSLPSSLVKAYDESRALTQPARADRTPLLRAFRETAEALGGVGDLVTLEVERGRSLDEFDEQ